MFHLTSGIIDQLINRQVLLGKSKEIHLPFKTKNAKENDKMNLLYCGHLILLQISDIYFFEKENVLGVELYDAAVKQYNYTAFIDTTKWHIIDRKYFPLKVNDKLPFNLNKKLTKGSVIVLKEYSFENIIAETTEKECENEKDKIWRFTTYLEDCLKLVDFVIVGHDGNFKSSLNSFYGS